MTEDDLDTGRRDDLSARSPSRPVAMWVGVVVILAVAVGAVVAVTGGTPDCGRRVEGVRASVCLDDPSTRPDAPDRAAPVLGAEDEQMGLDALRGDVVVVNFWASWCGPCRREQPELNRAASDLAPLDVSFLGVNVQDSSTANALSHAREFDIPYPSLEDPDASWTAAFDGVGARTLPSTVVVDREGRVAASLLGETTYGEVVALARAVAEE